MRPGQNTPEAVFTRLLRQWNRRSNRREMPWKGEKDPYRIWLSEIILQQTRVEQGHKYYMSFTNAFPTIEKLAAAKDRRVFRLWEGLGYYSRCRNLLFTARQISSERGGLFPTDYESILSLKGVGPYTAAAIASFAYGLPYAVLDGNVIRVLSRYFGIYESPSHAGTRKVLNDLAQRVLDGKDPGAHNQAIMDFGATICRPANPFCDSCPLRKTCHAYRENTVNMLPVKKNPAKLKTRWFYYFVLRKGNQYAVGKRTGKDIWSNLHEFPMVEKSVQLRDERIIDLSTQYFGSAATGNKTGVSPVFRQQLSHQLINARFLEVDVDPGFRPAIGFSWVTKRQTRHLAFPRLIRSYLDSR